MKRGGPLRRRTPLKRSEFRRSGGGSGPTRKVRQEVIERDEVCRAAVLVPSVRCGGGPHVHHVLPRSQGGGHDLSNLLLVCTVHHGWIHANPARSYTLGLLLRKSSGND
jgi:5-methylcytosine-specific restriction endonuclease McrA